MRKGGVCVCMSVCTQSIMPKEKAGMTAIPCTLMGVCVCISISQLFKFVKVETHHLYVCSGAHTLSVC